MLRRQNTYPSREYLKTPSYPSDIIQEELRAGGKGADLRHNLIEGLGALYGSTYLGKSLLEYSLLNTRARILARSAQGEDSVKNEEMFRSNAFYSGSLLAIHAETRLKAPDVQRVLFWSKCWEAMPYDPDEEMKQQLWLLDALNFAEAYSEKIEKHSPTTQKVLTQFAEMVYDDYPKEYRFDNEVDFVTGYLFGAQVIETLADIKSDLIIPKRRYEP